MSDPKGFLKFEREETPKKPTTERLRDWKEFYLPMPENRKREQATRCMDCGVPFCHSPPGCPVENLIPEWNRLVSDGRWDEALTVLHSTNNFPEFTGKLCPAPCEAACVLSINSAPVSIRAIESDIVERGFDKGWILPVLPQSFSGKKVAIIGSGPAGLAAAQQLRRLGHEVKVIEKNKELGGLLRYGIPDFKLEKKYVERRIGQLKAEGIEFLTSTEAGRDIAALSLLTEYDALCLTLGAESPRELTVPGRNLGGIIPAMDYLTEQNKNISGEKSGLSLNHASGKQVIIMGGGDTGSDCLGTALRQGATRVTQLELLPKPADGQTDSNPNWPNWPMKLRSSHAHEENGYLGREWAILTQEFTANPTNPDQVGSLKCVKVRWQQTQSGQPYGKFEEIPGSHFQIPADLVLIATGFTGVARGGLCTDLGLNLDANGRIIVDTQWMTNRQGVFAAGDASRGASLIVWAIAEGRKMAASVDHYLRNLKKHTPHD